MKSELWKSALNTALIVTAFMLILFGIEDNEAATVFTKAINICMECIGIG